MPTRLRVSLNVLGVACRSALTVHATAPGQHTKGVDAPRPQLTLNLIGRIQVRNRPLAVGLGVLALATVAVVAPVAALTPKAIPLAADPPIKFVQSPSAIPGQACRATTKILVSSHPGAKQLPNGLTMHIWDTGPVKKPKLAMLGMRVVSVRIPFGAAAGATILQAPNLSTSQTPTTLVSKRPNVLVAVNGAIFNMHTNATPDGPVLIGGVLQKGLASFADTLNFDKAGHISAGQLRLVATGSVTVPVDGVPYVSPLPITSLNHQVLIPGINIYTNAWGAKPHPAGLEEMWVQGAVHQVGTAMQFTGAVSEMRTTNLGQQPPATTAAGVTTWVLTSRADNDGYFAGFAAGQPVNITLDYQTRDRSGKPTTGIVSAMGRGGVYVAAGENRANCNHGNEELRPRTLIGWNSKTGDQWFVTIQGKFQRWGVRWGGATIHQAADYLISLGADMAVGLDGGGSTTMLIRSKVGATPVHIDRSNPKDGQRPVVNVIGIIPMPAPSPTATPTASPSASPSTSATPTP